jgi:hypothetical protein
MNKRERDVDNEGSGAEISISFRTRVDSKGYMSAFKSYD